eukprot:1738238-Prymnesium_polylepis.2
MSNQNCLPEGLPGASNSPFHHRTNSLYDLGSAEPHLSRTSMYIHNPRMSTLRSRDGTLRRRRLPSSTNASSPRLGISGAGRCVWLQTSMWTRWPLRGTGDNRVKTRQRPIST